MATTTAFDRKTSVEMTDIHGRRRTYDELDDAADRALAAEFGYNPVFERKFGFFSSISFAASISGMFATVTTTAYYPLIAGGAASVVWCWLISGAGCMCLAMSVAELISAYPTAGGLYYTVSRLAPADKQAGISWVTGWLNLLGQVAGVASSEYGAAQMLLAAVSLGTDLAYTPTIGHTIGVMAALTMVCGLINSLNTAWLARLTSTYLVIHVAVLVSCCIALLVKTPTEYRHTAEFVFTNVESTSGWAERSTPGFSFLFGFLSASWTLTDYDAVAHIAEEISRPEVKAPWALLWAMLFTYIGGWLFNIVLMFTCGDISELLGSPLAQPIVQLYANALGKTGGIAFTVFAFIIIQFVCFTAMQSLARSVFAFSRDKLLPFSRVWTIVNKTTRTPLYAVAVSTFWCIAINLIGLGSYAAISGVFNVTAVALDISFCIPVVCKLVWKDRFRPGPFHLGAASKWVNIYAIAWTAFVTIIYFFPVILPVTADNMNYAVVFMGFILLASLSWWWVRGKHVYTGPIMQTNIIETDIPSTNILAGEKQQRGSESNESHEKVDHGVYA